MRARPEARANGQVTNGLFGEANDVPLASRPATGSGDNHRTDPSEQFNPAVRPGQPVRSDPLVSIALTGPRGNVAVIRSAAGRLSLKDL